MRFFKQVMVELNRLSKIERFTLFATVVGLTVDLIALSSYINIVASVPESLADPRGSGRNGEFFVWMSIALLYSLGLINSFVYQRWLKAVQPGMQQVYYRLSTWQHRRWRESVLRLRATLAGLTSFPVTFIYLRALKNSPDSPFRTEALDSSWKILFASALLTIPVIFVVMFVAAAFDVIISAFSSQSK